MTEEESEMSAVKAPSPSAETKARPSGISSNSAPLWCPGVQKSSRASFAKSKSAFVKGGRWWESFMGISSF